MNLEHLKNRSEERMIAHFVDSVTEKSHCSIIGNNSDVGVIKNGGRLGSRFAPTSIVSQLKKLPSHIDKKIKIDFKPISRSELEENNTNEIYSEYERHILSQMNVTENIIHLGGGHDHAYQMAMAILKKYQKIIIINIDPHLDTRTDPFLHSGTPFRQIDQHINNNGYLIQVGYQEFANSDSTKTKLKNFKEYRLNENTDDSSVEELLAKMIVTLPYDYPIFLSIDCDSINSGIMSGVSAPNPYGHSPNHLIRLISLINTFKTSERNIYYGFYEFNPIYDDLSGIGAKTIATFIYKILENI